MRALHVRSAVLSACLVATGLDVVQVVVAPPPAVAAAPAEDTSSRPDVVSASMTARATGHRVLVTGLTTADSLTYANPDGSRTTQVASGPVRVPRDGEWRDIDPTLVPSGAGFRGAATYGDVVFSGTGAASVSRDGMSFGLRWPGPLPAPVVVANTATYRDVMPGADYVLAARPAGFEASVVLRSRPAAPLSLRLPVSLAGLSAAARPSGVVVLSDASGHEVGSVDTPLMWGAGGESSAVPVTSALVTTPDGPELRLTPDPAFLATAALPVTIDPTVTLAVGQDTRVNSEAPTTSYGSGIDLDAGRWTSTQINRSYAKFTVSGVLAGTHVTSASVKLWNWYAQTCAPASTALYKVTSSWSASTMTWSSGQPTMDYGTSATNSGAHGYTGTGSTCAAQDWLSFSSSSLTSLVQGWVDGTVANYGVQIAGSESAGCLTCGKGFRSSDYATVPARPVLEVTYNHYPGLVWGRGQSPGTKWGTTDYVTSTTPTLQGVVADADGGTTRVDFEVWNNAKTSLLVSGSSPMVPAGTSASWTVPMLNALTDGVTYQWRAKGHDGTDASQAYNSWIPFTVDATAPAAPSSLASAQYAANAWRTSGGAGTFTWTDTSTDVDHYVWGLDTARPSTVATSGTATVDPMPDGWHALSVRAVDHAGNVSAAATYAFGSTPAVTSPGAGAKTQGSVSLQARMANGQSAVTYDYRRSPTDAWTPIPVADVTLGGSGIVSWPVTWTPGSGDSVPPALVWNVAHTLSDVDGPVQVRVCFTTYCSTVPVDVTLNEDAFGDSYATAPVGPGSVSLLTGNLSVSSPDVSIASYGSDLSLSRTFNSRTPTTSGVFGDGWTPSLSVDDAGADYTGLADTGTTVNVALPDSSVISFAKRSDGSYVATGDDAPDGLVLTAVSPGTYGPGSYTLADLDGNVTTFTPNPALSHVASLTSPNPYSVSGVQQPGSSQTTTYTYTSGRVSRVLAPVPPGSTCTDSSNAATWTGGCRALQLTYDGAGHVTVVTFATVDPSAGTPLLVDVACYGYTGSKLTSFWDPRLAGTTCGTPVLPTTYSYDGSGRLASVTPPGLRAWTFGYDGAGRLSTVSRTHDASHNNGTTETTTVVYGVVLTADVLHPEYRPDLSPTAVATWAQADVPVTASAVFPPGTTASSTDVRDATVTYLDVNGRPVNTASYSGSGAAGWHVSTAEYDAAGKTVRALSAANREEALDPTGAAGAALGLPGDTRAAAAMLDERTFYSADGVDVTDTYGPYHLVTFDDGTSGPARAHTHTSYDTGSETGHPAGGSLHLPVSTVTTASRSAAADPAQTGVDVDARTTTSDYALDATKAEGWTFRTPLRSTVDPAGLNLQTIARYDTTTGLVTESRMPSDTGGTGVGTTRTIYWTAGTNPLDSACGNKPQWTSLACKVTHAASARVAGVMPDLPVTAYTYDYLLRPTVVTETVTRADGTSETRTTTSAYEASGYSPRLSSTTITGGSGPAVPVVTTSYDTSTGLPTTVSAAATAELAASSVVTGYDDFGRVTSYTDADANTATTAYEDTTGRVASVTDAKGSVSYTYNSTTEHRGLPTALAVSGITGTFTATYDAAGRLASQAWPNGLAQTVRYDETGATTSLTDTVSGNAWWTETATRFLSGQVRQRTATTSSQTYTYDSAGRLSRVEDTVGGACVTRTYAFDADSNRTGMTAYPAGSNALCQSATGGVTTSHAYDTADRLTGTYDSGIAYDPWGRVTSLPAADAGGAPLTTAYYANDLVRAQTQSSRTLTWTLDATLRLRTWTDSTSGVTKTNHYDGGSDSPAWIAEGGSSWTRNVTGLDGNLLATITQAGTVTYQVTDMHGDTVATSSAAAVTSPDGGYSDTDEYGNPRTGVTPRYGWLGGKQRSGDAEAGVLLMGVRLYVPYLGRFLQTDPVPGGSANAYDYVDQDPVNQYDLAGTICFRCFLKKKWVRMVAAAVAAAVICAGVPGLGCMILAGAIAGGGLGAANYRLNTSRRTGGGYFRSAAFGMLEGAEAGFTAGSLQGKELSFGRNFRVAPGGNRGPGRYKLPHYHRRFPGEGGGIRWHRPWQKGW